MSKDNLKESALSFYLVGFRGPTVVIKLSGKYLCLLYLLSLMIISNVEQQKLRFNTPEGNEATVPSRRPAPSALPCEHLGWVNTARVNTAGMWDGLTQRGLCASATGQATCQSSLSKQFTPYAPSTLSFQGWKFPNMLSA